MSECRDHLTNRVLQQAGNMACPKNAERDLLNLLRVQGMTIPIRPAMMKCGINKVEFPYIQLKTWWEYLLSKHPCYVMGGFGFGSMSQLCLSTYWSNIEKIMPDHAIFSIHDEKALSQSIPFYLHMDEGVGQRKRGVMIYAFQPVLGQETADRYFENFRVARVRSVDDAKRSMSESQFHASKGNTYQSRFLYTVLPKKSYSKKNEDVYHDLLKALSDECCELMKQGIKIRGTTYYPICMGLKGDGPALGKAGYFTRYFATMGKDKGCCHECLAGHPGFEFENCSPSAPWISTIGLVPPWNPDRMSPLSRIPHQKNFPEKFYRKDPFHIFKQSLGGHFISNAIVAMACDLQVFTIDDSQSTAVQSCLDRAYLDFEYYVKHEWRGKNINHLKAFTKEIFHFSRVNSYPAARFKGSDCMMLLRWLRHLVLNGAVDEGHFLRPGQSLADQPGKQWESDFFSQLLKACVGGVQFFHSVHSEGLWLSRSSAQDLAASCQDFCEAYSKLAQMCFERKWTRFRMEPCLHHFHHFSVECRIHLRSEASYIPSPACDLCEADEDFVGKIARASRCVHMSSMTQRTIERYLVKLWFEHSG